MRTPSVPRFFTVFAEPSALAEMAQRYDIVIWHNHSRLQHALVQLKRHRQAIQGLMYRQLFCVAAHETPMRASTGSYEWIVTHHHDWLQRDTRGRAIEVPDAPGRWMMNLGHPGWRAFWIERTLREVIEGGWDGAFVDDALTTVRAHQLPPLAGYPDDAALQQTVYEFLTHITDAFRAKGKLVIANVSSSYDYPGLWERWLRVTDGLMEEHFAGEGWTMGRDVAERQIEAMRAADRMGKWMLCGTYGPYEDRERMGTSLAAYLIGAGAKTCWFYRPAEQSVDPLWNLSWDMGLGQPLAWADVDGSVWQRRFEQGIVVVNAGSHKRTVLVMDRPMTLQPRQGIIVGQWMPSETLARQASGPSAA